MSNKNAVKKTAKSLMSWLLTIAIMLPMFVSGAGAAAAGTLTFTSTSGGKNLISLTEEREFEAVLTLSKQVDPATVTWSLSREKGMQDAKLFPYQNLGGALADWKVWDTDKPLFTGIETQGKTVDGNPALVLTFSSEYFFGVNRMDSPRNNRNVILDFTGEYILACKDKDGSVLGQTTVVVNPYDDYKTNAQLAQSLIDAKTASNSISGVYMEVKSLGTSTQGYDMPYAVISDSKQSIDSYLAQNKLAMENPQKLIDQLKAGTLDYKIPVLYSNIHADETSGADAPMNFIWDVINALDTGSGKITYKVITGFTAEGEAQLKSEMEAQGIQWSELIKEYVTGLGFITGGNTSSGQVELEKYYKVEEYTLDINQLLDNVILIVVPAENADGRTNDVRQNGNGFDLNRDNMFQTQIETQNMTKMIAQWNPATLIELHGFVAGYQVEPCSPPHEPNFEYDLFAEYGLKGGEAFGIGAIANNAEMNSYVMPLRDYLVTDKEGNPYWAEPWDDMSTNYTPQYSMLHGTVAYTIEVPKANQAATTSLEYGLINHAAFVMENKEALYLNQLTGWLRGINNVDAPEISPWYVDMNDNAGAEAEVYRPKYTGNNNFFPECYIIPLDSVNQGNLSAAYAMQAQLLENGVKVHTLNQDVTIKGVTYLKGSMVVSMYQAKRNVANGALYDGALITEWTDLYSEPVTAFGHMRGFDCAAIDVKDAVKGSMLTEVTAAQTGKTAFTGATGAHVIIDNNSLDAIAMVNAMLEEGVKVGFITTGANKADFVTGYADFAKYQDKYIVTATGVQAAPKAQLLKKAAIYIPGYAGDYSKDSAGNPYGVYNYPNYSNTNYNFDKFAYGQQMGFTITGDVKTADMIVGNRAINGDALSAVKAGKPYLAAGVGTLDTVKKELLGQYGFDFLSTGTNQDCLFFVTYGQDSLTTASYVKTGDNLVYSYGGGLITAVPQGGTVLMTATKDTPLEGFIKSENLEQFLGSVQAFAYKANGLDITVFAGSLTNKAHQQDDYQFAANTIFAKTMTNVDYETGFADVSSHWGYGAIVYAWQNKLFSGTSATTFAPDVTMTRGMMATVLYNLSGETEVGAPSFTDVAAGAWYAKGIAWAEKNGIVTGLGGGLFAPDAPVTREQAAIMLYNYAKHSGKNVTASGDLTAFPDGAAVSTWAQEAVKYAVGSGTIGGMDGKLAPQGGATRAQMATILQRYLSK